MKLDAEERQLAEYRALRDEAWALLKEDVAALNEDVEQRGIGARLTDRVTDEVREIWDQALEVADAHRGVVVATVIALVGWVFREPIMDRVSALFGHDDSQVHAPREQSTEGDEN